MNIKISNLELENQLKKWRKHFHMYPESAFNEKKSADYIAKELESMGLEVHRGIGKTGIVANLHLGNGGKNIGFRADMDCIELNEETNLSYSSKFPNRMHACGHDGHMATLLGAAKLLSNSKGINGTIRFIFQPAEEPGKGAQAMIDDGLFEKFPVDEIYGIHNMPSLPSGEIHTRPGGIMASEDNFIITIKGKGAHASSPNLGIDPIVIGAEIVLALQTIVSRYVDPVDMAVVSCTEIVTDGIRNAIPSKVIIKGDTRSFNAKTQKIINEKMKEISKNITSAHGGQCQLIYTNEFKPTINTVEETNFAIEAAKKVVGEGKINGFCRPMLSSEDFGLYLENVPGCFAFIGGAKSDEIIPLHNSRYDYNDDILIVGARYFEEIARLRLK